MLGTLRHGEHIMDYGVYNNQVSSKQSKNINVGSKVIGSTIDKLNIWKPGHTIRATFQLPTLLPLQDGRRHVEPITSEFEQSRILVNLTHLKHWVKICKTFVLFQRM